MAVALHKASHLIGNLVDDCEPLRLSFDLLELDVLDVLDDDLVDL